MGMNVCASGERGASEASSEAANGANEGRVRLGASEGRARGERGARTRGGHEGCNLAGAKDDEKIFVFSFHRRYALINSESCGIYSLNILFLMKKTFGQ